jgi:putative holliday junction resolvase
LRVLGVDFGSKRIGIATGDTQLKFASAHSVLERSGSHKTDHEHIGALAAEEETSVIVVGLPIDLQGNHGIAAQGVLAEVQELTTVVGMPVETYDERMTSAVALKNLRATGQNSRKSRGQVDKHAAAIMLQGWIDSHQSHKPPVDPES